MSLLLGRSSFMPMAEEANARLLRELGLQRPPHCLADLAGEETGLICDDVEALQGAIERTAAGGGAIARMVRAAGSSRVFEVRGGLAPSPEPAGTILFWLSDMSSSEAERSKLTLRLRQTEGALDSLTHLIESAPFPTWYRGPDLKLGLVNSAFVQAVEGRDAADGVARSIELVDFPGEESAQSAAARALETGRPQSRSIAAIICGERRMLRIVDVPLQTGAVAGFATDIQNLEDARAELARHIESQRELPRPLLQGRPFLCRGWARTAGRFSL